MEREIKFRRNGCHSSMGNFGAGDVLRCHPLLAAHFVEQGCAKYTDEKPAEGALVTKAEAKAAAKPAPKVNKARN